MPTPPKDNSTENKATSSNSSATANNASPAPSSSAGIPPPPSFSRLKPILRMPAGSFEGKRYAPALDGGPPNGGYVPGVYQDRFNGNYHLMPEPPLAQPTGGTRAEQPPPPYEASSSQGQNAQSDKAGKGQGGGK